MNLSDTPIRAVVPYVAPESRTRHPVPVFRAFLRRLSRKMDALFVRQKGMYLSALALTAFGLLVGCYFAAAQRTQVELLLSVRTAQILIPIIFFSSVTLFGIICVPLCLFSFSFLCGCAAGQLSASTAHGILCFGMLLLLSFSLLLFAVEAFLTSRRSFSGWRALFARKSFLSLCILFLISYFLDRATEFLLLTFV